MTSEDSCLMPDLEREIPNPENISPGPKRWPLYIVVFAMVFIPYKFWRDTWFGGELTDAQILEYAADSERPRRAQHALVQISQIMNTTMMNSEIMNTEARPAKKFYPLIQDLSRHEQFKVRSTSAWVMGQDNQSQAFHRTLLSLLEDPQPLVRYNAALALANFNDVAALPVLRHMLKPLEIFSDKAGKIVACLRLGDPVVAETQIASLLESQEKTTNIFSPLAGKISDVFVQKETQVRVGDKICIIDPSFSQVWETLRALYLVGKKEDLEIVEAFARPSASYPERITMQARLTADILRQR